MKKLLIIIVALATLSIPSLAFAEGGTFMLTTPVVGVTDGSLDIIVEYSFTESLAIGLDYNEAASRPFLRYYFSGGGDSFFLGVGYILSDASATVDTNITLEGGYNLKWDLFTAEIGYETGATADDGGLLLRVGIYF